MIRSGLVVAFLALCVAPQGHFPGLSKLIEAADAIVVLRVDRHLSDFGSPTFSSQHDCYIYQSLKGDIPASASIRLQLVSTEASFATPYAHGSTHLMFLMKKATEDEPTEYRTLTYRGAQTLLSPLGQEKPPEGRSIEDRIKGLIRSAMAYQTQEYEKSMKFMESMIAE